MVKQGDNTQQHQRPAQADADARGDVGRAAEVAGARPDQRAQHAPAIERIAGDRVEKNEHDIDRGEPVEDERGFHPAGAP